ncbi:MAG TPA: ABC transporter ATP-binding protein [Fimbriimonadaceae bacterium]|nr:ABC transporter ATP-binding protein [Fimbriimonadaceae bacterium]
MPDVASKDFRSTRELIRVLGRVWQYVRPYRSKFFLAILFVLLTVPLTQLAIFLTRDVANKALLAVGSTVDQRWETVLGLIGLQALFLFASSLFWIIREVLEWYCSMRASYDMRLAYFRHLLRLPLEVLRQRPPGEHLYRATIDFYSTTNSTGYFQVSNQDGYDPGVAGVIVRLVPMLIETLYSLAWGAALLSLIDPVLGIGLLVYAIPYNIAAWSMYSKIRQTQFLLRAGAESEAAVLRDSVAGMRTIKSHGRTALQRLKFITSSIAMRRENIRLLGQVVFSEHVVLWFVRWVFNCSVYIYMTLQVMHGRATIGDWLATMLLVAALVKSDLEGIDPDAPTASKPMEKVVQIIQRMRVDLVPAQRIMETLDQKPQLGDRDNPVVLNGLQGSITFEDVGLSYIEGNPALRGVSIEIQPGEFVGFVGPSGAGKSSILSVALRLYLPDQGRVLIDAHDLNDVALDSYLNQVGVVPQSTYLYDGTIADNIRFGKPRATDAEVEAVVKLTGMEDFVSRQPEGLETMIGEGSKISGGEKQRIGIARALIRDPKILILDEATANLDPISEASLSQVIAKVRQGRTVLCVAHRLKTVVGCDKIVVLKDGLIEAIGTHESLLNKSTTYRDLWIEQSNTPISSQAGSGVEGGSND